MSDNKILVGDMSRKQCLEILKRLLEAMETFDGISPSPERINALKMAISSLETDEAYQLEYEKLEFMRAKAAMCEHFSQKGCENCPLDGLNCNFDTPMSVQDAEKMQAIVEKWINRNGETNSDKFLQVFGMEWADLYCMNNVNAETWSKQKYERG